VTFFESISQQIFLASAEQVRRFAFLALTRFFVTSLFCQTQTPGTSISFSCRKNRYDKTGGIISSTPKMSLDL
jgi:hypothetical protein